MTLMELLTQVTVIDLILALTIIVVIVGILIAQKDKISNKLNKWRKVENEKEDFKKLVYELKTTMESYQENREHDREDSIRIRKEMYDVIDKQSETIEKQSGMIEELKDIVVKMQEKNAKTKRAELKKDIEGLYRECHPHMKCTKMALETLRDLIEEYEEHGGDNSFVHTIVEPEMCTWQIVENIEGGEK